MTLTSFDEFTRLAERGTFVPVCKELMADLLTPASAFLKIAEHSEYAFLLESVEGGEHVGRYSFLGKDPFAVLRGRAGRTLIERAGVTTESREPAVDALRRLMHAYQSPTVPGLPRFTGGAVGYLSYEAAARMSRPPVLLDGDEDEAGFMLFDTVLAFDHVRHRILVIANAHVTEDEDLEALYQFACARIQFVERELQRPLSEQVTDGTGHFEARSDGSREQCERLIRAARDRVRLGDLDHVVISQRFDGYLDADPFTVYRALRHVSPSPYMYFVRIGGSSIVGSSPEMLVRVEGERVETHPIAGAASGSVDGRLEPGRDRLDTLLTCCPAETVTGAPKDGAIAALAELEPGPRGVFSGAVGYVDCAGNLDFCVAIRTIVIAGQRAQVQATAAVGAESNPSAVYQRIRDEARTLVAALDLAEMGLHPGEPMLSGMP